jgi:hypothetical protein
MKQGAAGLVFLLLLTGAARAADPAPVMTLDAIKVFIAGTWQSDADTKLTRELDTDGTAIERHDGDEGETTRGTWLLFSGSAPPPEAARHKFSAKGIYIELKQQGDVLLYELVRADRQSLDLIYLERDSALSFSRLK